MSISIPIIGNIDEADIPIIEELNKYIILDLVKIIKEYSLYPYWYHEGGNYLFKSSLCKIVHIHCNYFFSNNLIIDFNDSLCNIILDNNNYLFNGLLIDNITPKQLRAFVPINKNILLYIQNKKWLI